jgi:hypothetical protein
LILTDDLRALEGWIAGAALDVTEPEPLPLDHPIRTLPRVLLTPHAAWYSEEAEPELRRRAARTIVQALRGERPTTLLNRRCAANRRLLFRGAAAPDALGVPGARACACFACLEASRPEQFRELASNPEMVASLPTLHRIFV